MSFGSFSNDASIASSTALTVALCLLARFCIAEESATVPTLSQRRVSGDDKGGPSPRHAG
jgi:hypothetical protein